MPFDLPTWGDTTAAVSKQVVMLSVKECFGYLVLLGMMLTLLVLLSNYRTTVVRLLPRMTSIRIWLSSEKRGDPRGSVSQAIADTDKPTKPLFRLVRKLMRKN